MGNASFHEKPLFRLSEEKNNYIRMLANDLLKIGLIRGSTSNITANGFLVPEKTGGYRLCIDYVELNKNTVKDNYPMPRIEGLHDRLLGAQAFSKLHLQSYCYQLRMKEEDIHKTAFAIRHGSFEFLVMPFGLCNVPASFQKLMHQVLFEYLDAFVVVYLDDILIYSKSYEDRIYHLHLVFKKIRQYSLYINREKCESTKAKLQHLGFIVSSQGLETESGKVKAIHDWPTPFKIIHDVRAFLDLSSYYRKFIMNYAEKVAPLTELLQMSTEKKWTQKHTDAVLALPDYSQQFLVYTDASSFAIGAQLTQNIKDVERPMAFVAYFMLGIFRNK